MVKKAWIYSSQDQTRNYYFRKHYFRKHQINQADVEPQQALLQAPHSSQARQYRVFVKGKGNHHLRLFCHFNLKVKSDELSCSLELGNFSRQIFRLVTRKDMEYTTYPKHNQEKDELNVFMGNQSRLYLRCRPREKKDVKKPMVVVRINANHTIQPDSLLSDFLIRLQIYHQKQKTFRFLLPQNSEIISISEKRWDTEEKNGQKYLIVQLEKKAEGTHFLNIKCERQLGNDGSFTLPKFVAVCKHLFRQYGTVYVEKSPEIRLQVLEKGDLWFINPHDAFSSEIYGKRQIYSKSHRPRRKKNPFLAFRFWGKQKDLKLHKKNDSIQARSGICRNHKFVSQI